jgi:hypothetical protein
MAGRLGGEEAGTRGRGELGSLTRIEDLEETGHRIDRELLAICKARVL